MILKTSRGEEKSYFCKELFPVPGIFPFMLLILTSHFFQGNASKGHQVSSQSKEIQNNRKMTIDCCWVKVEHCRKGTRCVRFLVQQAELIHIRIRNVNN